MALIVVENGKGEGIDVGGDAKTEHQHQKGRAEQRKAEPDPIAYQFQRFANGASSEAPQTEGAAVARRSGCDGLLCCKDSLSCSDKTTRSRDRKSTRLNSSHLVTSYAVFCLKKKKRSHAGLEQYPRNGDPRAVARSCQFDDPQQYETHRLASCPRLPGYRSHRHEPHPRHGETGPDVAAGEVRAT